MKKIMVEFLLCLVFAITFMAIFFMAWDKADKQNKANNQEVFEYYEPYLMICNQK